MKRVKDWLRDFGTEFSNLWSYFRVENKKEINKDRLICLIVVILSEITNVLILIIFRKIMAQSFFLWDLKTQQSQML